MVPSALRFTDYNRKPNPMYAHEFDHHKRMSYVRKAKLSYDREGRHQYVIEREEE